MFLQSPMSGSPDPALLTMMWMLMPSESFPVAS